MNNWDYAGDIPTSTWRGSMSLPREVVLTDTAEGPRLRQQVVSQIDGQLDTKAAKTLSDVAVDGDTALGLAAEVAKLDVTLRPGDADAAGITVFSDGKKGTQIGYDTRSGRLFVDRTNSGNVDFHPSYPSISDAPLALDEDGTVTLEIYLDRASVELFTGDGMLSITDQVFPEAGATAVSAWSRGGAATIEDITVTPLTPTMWQVPDPVDEAAITLSSKTVKAGGTVTVSGTGFEPGAGVKLELRSDPVSLGAATADANGGLRQQVTIPAATPVGAHTLVVLRADGAELSAPLTVTARDGGGAGGGAGGGTGGGAVVDPGGDGSGLPGGLANTGAEPWLLLAAGVLTVLTGAALLRHRSRSRLR